MSMARVRTAHSTSTGTIVDTGAVLVGLYITSAGNSGDVVLKDGGSGGTTKLTIGVPGVAEGQDVTMPMGGIEFKTDIHLDTLATGAKVTVFVI